MDYEEAWGDTDGQFDDMSECGFESDEDNEKMYLRKIARDSADAATELARLRAFRVPTEQQAERIDELAALIGDPLLDAKYQRLYDTMDDSTSTRGIRVRRFAALLARDWRHHDHGSPYKLSFTRDDDDPEAPPDASQQADTWAFQRILDVFDDAYHTYHSTPTAESAKWWFEMGHPDVETLITRTLKDADAFQSSMQATMNAEARKTKLKNKHKKDKERKRAHKEAAERCGCDEAKDVKPAVLSNGGASDAVKGGNGIVPSMIPPSHGVCQIAVAATLLLVPPPAPLSSEVAVMGK